MKWTSNFKFSIPSKLASFVILSRYLKNERTSWENLHFPPFPDEAKIHRCSLEHYRPVRLVGSKAMPATKPLIRRLGFCFVFQLENDELVMTYDNRPHRQTLKYRYVLAKPCLTDPILHKGINPFLWTYARTSTCQPIAPNGLEVKLCLKFLQPT